MAELTFEIHRDLDRLKTSLANAIIALARQERLARQEGREADRRRFAGRSAELTDVSLLLDDAETAMGHATWLTIEAEELTSIATDAEMTVRAMRKLECAMDKAAGLIAIYGRLNDLISPVSEMARTAGDESGLLPPAIARLFARRC